MACAVALLMIAFSSVATLRALSRLEETQPPAEGHQGRERRATGRKALRRARRGGLVAVSGESGAEQIAVNVGTDRKSVV